MLHKISVLPGRVRFRSSRIYENKLLARYINSYIDCLYGINYSSANYSTGSILIVYDVEKTNCELIAENIEAAIDSKDMEKEKEIEKQEFYYKAIEKRNKSKRNFLFFGIVYLVLKIKHATVGKFSISRNVGVLKAASAVTIIGGYPLLKKLYKKFGRSVPTDADILLKLSAASFTLLRESDKGVFVLVLKNLSDYIKHSAEVQCLHTLNAGMGKTSGMAWLVLDNNEEILVSANALKSGDNIRIHKGEISPVQGEIVGGNAVINSLYSVGQPIVEHVTSGNNIQEGVTVVFGALKVKVETIPASIVKRELSLNKLNIHKKVGAYQDKVTKVALGAAGLNYILTGSMLNALSILLVLTPSATATALTNGMKNYVAALKSYSIYLKNPNTFEKIINTDSIMFDKTGTLTYGNMKSVNVDSFNDEYYNIDSELAWTTCMKDEVRKNAHLLIDKLKYSGINDISLLTGDIYEKSCNTAEALGIQKVYAECSNEDKLSVITEANKFHTVMMVGDGVNDIDAMKAADVSISFANSACDKIKLQSDCIVFEDNIERLADLIYMSQRAHRLIKQSIAFSQIWSITLGGLAFFQYFDAFTAKSLNTINSLIVLLLNQRIHWITPDKTFNYEIKRNKKANGDYL